jgi:hypothetical protein
MNKKRGASRKPIGFRTIGKGKNRRVIPLFLPKNYRAKLMNQSYDNPEKVLSPFISCLPKQDRGLFDNVYVGEVHPERGKASGLWLAMALGGGRLWLRYPPHDANDQVTILHEYGHYVWFFELDDEMKKVFREYYEQVKNKAKLKASHPDYENQKPFYPYRTWEDYFTSTMAGRNEKEAFAEAYAKYYADFPTRHGASFRSILRENQPEMYQALRKIERRRVK